VREAGTRLALQQARTSTFLAISPLSRTRVCVCMCVYVCVPEQPGPRWHRVLLYKRQQPRNHLCQSRMTSSGGQAAGATRPAFARGRRRTIHRGASSQVHLSPAAQPFLISHTHAHRHIVSVSVCMCEGRAESVLGSSGCLDSSDAVNSPQARPKCLVYLSPHRVASAEPYARIGK
jgi:hypothetical protein